MGGYSKNFGSDEIDSSFLGTTYTVLGAAANKRYAASELKGPGKHVYKYKSTEK